MLKGLLLFGKKKLIPKFSRGEDEMEVHLPIKPKAPGEQGKITVSQSQALFSSADQ